MEPDQAHPFVRPNLGPNCLQKCQQTTPAGKELMLFPTMWHFDTNRLRQVCAASFQA